MVRRRIGHRHQDRNQRRVGKPADACQSRLPRAFVRLFVETDPARVILSDARRSDRACGRTRSGSETAAAPAKARSSCRQPRQIHGIQRAGSSARSPDKPVATANFARAHERRPAGSANRGQLSANFQSRSHDDFNLSRIGGHGRCRRHGPNDTVASAGISAFRKNWSERRDSNPRPPVPQTDALPGCATLRPCGRVV